MASRNNFDSDSDDESLKRRDSGDDSGPSTLLTALSAGEATQTKKYDFKKDPAYIQIITTLEAWRPNQEPNPFSPKAAEASGTSKEGVFGKNADKSDKKDQDRKFFDSNEGILIQNLIKAINDQASASQKQLETKLSPDAVKIQVLNSISDVLKKFQTENYPKLLKTGAINDPKGDMIKLFQLCINKCLSQISSMGVSLNITTMPGS